MDERTIALIKTLNKKGVGYNRIAALLSITRYQVVKYANPEQHERERQRNMAWNNRNRETWQSKKDSWKRKMEEVPEDTRTYSQQVMGEPLPGRSALDQKQREQWEMKSVAIKPEDRTWTGSR